MRTIFVLFDLNTNHYFNPSKDMINDLTPDWEKALGFDSEPEAMRYLRVTNIITISKHWAIRKFFILN